MKAILKRTMRAVVLSLSLGLALGQAQAATTYDLDLSGIKSQGVSGSFDAGGFHYDYWGLSLGEIFPFTVEQGDTINATITLDEGLTIPASVVRTVFDLQFGGGFTFPAGPVEVSGSTSFFLGGTAGLTGSFGTSTSGALINSSVWIPPDNGDITFDTVVSSFTITTLSGPADLTFAQIGYLRVSESVIAVPEPETYALLLVGLGLIGAVARRRENKHS